MLSGILRKINVFFWLTKALFLTLFFLVSGCSSSSHPKENELPKVAVELIRFESLFYGDLNTPLSKIKKSFPYFFPAQTPDSIWVEKRKDSLQQLLFHATKSFSTTDLQKRTESVFKHVKYYFPTEKLPQRAISLITDVDYSLRAVDADSLLLISIDTYLGGNHPLYEGIPMYIREKLTEKHLEAEIINALSDRFVSHPKSRTFLAQAVTHGKRLLLHDYFAPDVPQNQHIQYSQAHWDWAVNHEEEIWRYFVDNELLFSTDDTLRFRFLSPSPYSKFYTFLDADSPGRLGQWIGYRMVQAYKKRTNATLQKVLKADANDILKKSRYNP